MFLAISRAADDARLVGSLLAGALPASSVTTGAVIAQYRVSPKDYLRYLSGAPIPSINADAHHPQHLTRKHSLTYHDFMKLSSDTVADAFVAISHPARRQMLDLLIEGPQPVNWIAGRFEMSRPAVSQHLRILRDAGLVADQRVGRERRYRLVPERLEPVHDWIRHYDRFWDERLKRLEEHLAKDTTK
ncbi:ArsR/SmtB family transcription factor [Allorhodopirellula solitaria]|uniref:Transcriptional repressor SdpR n=1 Tax=Allorhodopirellula solitaria TaxID=2527987 RepID=A0A5C5X025_9BACT|nr:metalloregulator ArsR/SmtB family transcription factor [Allorhodopirellula solitaria]TWT55505.1 Transcriptional repressor SdpR [Allorhodopirellula solitaria]